jgi:hypothetical protein
MAGKNIIKAGKLVVLKKANLVKELQRVGGKPIVNSEWSIVHKIASPNCVYVLRIAHSEQRAADSAENSIVNGQ